MRKILSLLGRTALSLAILLLAVAVVALMGRRERPKLQQPRLRAMVEVAPAEAHRGPFDFEVDGVVVPYREVNVAAEVGGRVIYKSPRCRAGRTVREGDLLFRIDPTEYLLEIERLEEEVEQAAGMLEELAVEAQSAEEQIRLAEEDLRIRQRELARYVQAPDPSVFSQAEIDTAKRNELAARNALQSSRDQLRLLEARKRRVESGEQTARTALRRAELDRDRAEVRARISGVIIEESVQQEGFVTKGSILVSIRDPSRMEVRCSLRMQQLQWLWQSSGAAASTAEPGAEGRAEPAAAAVAEDPTQDLSGYEFPRTSADVLYELNGVTYRWQGTLARYAESGVDARTRMVPCIVEVSDPHRARRDGAPAPGAAEATGTVPPTLLSGMFVSVRVRAHLPRTLVTLPTTAVGPGGDVWLVDERLTLQRVRGEVIQAGAERVLLEATARLPVGARVVTSPLVNPIEGAPVGLAPGAEQTAAAAGSDNASPAGGSPSQAATIQRGEGDPPPSPSGPAGPPSSPAPARLSPAAAAAGPAAQGPAS